MFQLRLFVSVLVLAVFVSCTASPRPRGRSAGTRLANGLLRDVRGGLPALVTTLASQQLPLLRRHLRLRPLADQEVAGSAVMQRGAVLRAPFPYQEGPWPAAWSLRSSRIILDIKQ